MIRLTWRVIFLLATLVAARPKIKFNSFEDLIFRRRNAAPQFFQILNSVDLITVTAGTTVALSLPTQDPAAAFQANSPNGHCGAEYGFSCLGSIWGECCSLNGWCGSGDLYCTAGACQPEFGVCDGPLPPTPPAPITPAPVNGPAAITATTAPAPVASCYASLTTPDYCVVLPPFPTTPGGAGACMTAAVTCIAVADNCTDKVNQAQAADLPIDDTATDLCSSLYGVCGTSMGNCLATATGLA